LGKLAKSRPRPGERSLCFGSSGQLREGHCVALAGHHSEDWLAMAADYTGAHREMDLGKTRRCLAGCFKRRLGPSGQHDGVAYTMQLS
jgi:hypothetical protein